MPECGKPQITTNETQMKFLLAEANEGNEDFFRNPVLRFTPHFSNLRFIRAHLWLQTSGFRLLSMNSKQNLLSPANGIRFIEA
jgi:hypothetical protein